MDELKAITDALIELEEDETLRLVQEALARDEPSLSLVHACDQAMRVIGERYQRQEYYLSGLILAGEIFSEVLAMAQPRLERELVGEASGRVLLGTVAGDIHDIGKNLMATMLRSFGFTVYDIGVDVPPGAFVEAALEWRPDIVGLSGLITASFASMKLTTALLKAEPKLAPPPFVVLGGGIVDEAVRDYAGADSWSTNAMEGVRICQRLVADKSRLGGRRARGLTPAARGSPVAGSLASSCVAGEQLGPEVPQSELYDPAGRRRNRRPSRPPPARPGCASSRPLLRSSRPNVSANGVIRAREGSRS